MFENLGVLASWRENSRGWCRRLLVFSLALITIVSVIPHGSDAQTVVVASIGLDKIVHFVGFGFMAVFALGAGGNRRNWKGISLLFLVLGFGVVIEVVQYYLPYRTFNPVDIFANLCGVGFGGLVYKVVSRGRGRCQMSDVGGQRA